MGLQSARVVVGKNKNYPKRERYQNDVSVPAYAYTHTYTHTLDIRLKTKTDERDPQTPPGSSRQRARTINTRDTITRNDDKVITIMIIIITVIMSPSSRFE